MSFKFKK